MKIPFRTTATWLAIIHLALWLGATQRIHATVTIEFYFSEAEQEESVGILVADRAGDGFQSLSNGAAMGTALSPGEAIGGGDDVIVAVLQAEGGSHWENGAVGFAETIERIDYSTLGISAGTPLAFYVFPNITQQGRRLMLGDRYLSYRRSDPGTSGGDIAFLAPESGHVQTIAALNPDLGGDLDLENPQPEESIEEGDTALRTGPPLPPDDYGNRGDEAATITGGQTLSGILTPGDVDFVKINLDQPSLLRLHATGSLNTLGYLFDSNGVLLNDPGADGNQGTDDNFATQQVLEPGEYFIAVRGQDDNQDGSYDLSVESLPGQSVSPFFRPDSLVGKSTTRLRGNGKYNTSGAGQALRRVAKPRKNVKTYFRVDNDGVLPDTVRIRATGRDRRFKAIYHSWTGPRQNVTAAITRAGLDLDLTDGESQSYRLQVKPSKKAKGKRKTFSFTATSGSKSRPSDVAKAQVKAKKK